MVLGSVVPKGQLARGKKGGYPSNKTGMWAPGERGLEFFRSINSGYRIKGF